MDCRGYDYGGGSGAGGKIRRRPPSRAAAASPYARPAPASAPSSLAASQVGGWFSRIITAGASRLLPSLFRKSPPQLTAPAPPPRELHEEPPSCDLLPESRLDRLDAPPSPLPPPLEDDLPEGEKNGGVAANNLCTENPSSAKEKEEDKLRNSDDHGGMDLEDLLKQRTFTRSEFEYLSDLLWSRTIGSSSLKPEDGSIRKIHVYKNENGSRHSKMPVDFSITTYSVADQVASPAEIAKAYMGSKSSKGSPLSLRLHDPSSMPIQCMEANMVQRAKPPTIPLLQGSRLHTSKTSDRLESSYATPNRSAICKMSSSPYFKGGVYSKELFSTVTSPYQTPSSVHTFGRQVLKRKSTAVNNEIVSVGPIRRMHQRYNRTSPLLETCPGYHRNLGGHGSKLDEGPEQLAQTQKRRCLDKIGNAALGSLNDRAHVNCFGQAPVQSAEMAAKILKQLDTLVPSQKETMPVIKEKHGNAMDLEDLVSQKKEVSADGNLLEPSPSEVKEYSLPDGITSNTSIPQITSNKTKAPTFYSRSKGPSNLVLSGEIDPQKMSTPSNGFTFPVPIVTNTHSQIPPTPTMSPQQQPSAFFNASITSAEIGQRISKSVSGDGPIVQKFDSKLNADDQSMRSKNSGQGASFTSNHVFKVVNSKTTSLNNGLSNSTASAIQPSNGSTNSSSFQIAASSTITNSASKSTQSSSTGGSSSFSNGFGILSVPSNMFAGTSQSVATPSLASSGTGSPSASFGFSRLGTASSLVAEDKSKAVSRSETASSLAAQGKSEPANSSTPFSSSQQFGIACSSATQDKAQADNSIPFGFSQQFGIASSACEDMSKAGSPKSTIFSRNQDAQSGNDNSLITQSPANNLCFKSEEKSKCGNSQSFADSPIGPAVGSSPSNSRSLLSSSAGSSPIFAAGTAPTSATVSSFALGSSPAFSVQSASGSKLTTAAAPSFSLLSTGSATSPFSSTPNAVFSFTSATPAIPNLSPTALFGPTVQMNGGSMAVDRNGSPSPIASPFGLPSSSPSTPTFSTPATQFASTTSASPGIFQFGQQSQASAGGFSIGSGGGNDKSGRRIIRVKKRK